MSTGASSCKDIDMICSEGTFFSAGLHIVSVVCKLWDNEGSQVIISKEKNECLSLSIVFGFGLPNIADPDEMPHYVA